MSIRVQISNFAWVLNDQMSRLTLLDLIFASLALAYKAYATALVH